MLGIGRGGCRPAGLVVAAMAFLLLSAGGSTAQADMYPYYGFYCITNNDADDAATGEEQLFVDLIDLGSGQVMFRFRNTGPKASSICDVYFDDGQLFGIANLVDADDGDGGHPDVDFTEDKPGDPVSPGHLPGDNNVTPKFEVTSGFLADSDSPGVSHNGVGPEEWLGIVFDLKPGKNVGHIVSDIAGGDLRIGIHVQGMGREGEGSESFINYPDPIPAPGAVVLGAMGIGLVAWVKRHGFSGLGERAK